VYVDWRERHIGPITTRTGDDGGKATVDVGALVRSARGQLLPGQVELRLDNLGNDGDFDV
jgi:hypothetical protein